MLIPVFWSFQQTTFEFKEALRLSPGLDREAVTGNLVVKIKSKLLTAFGTTVKLNLKGITAGSTSVTAAYAGKSSVTGHSAGFAETPTQITVGGSGTFTVPPSGVITDQFSLDMSEGGSAAYSFAFHINNSRFVQDAQRITQYPIGLRPEGYLAGDIIYYWKAGSNDTSTVAKSNYSANPDRTVILGNILVA